MYSVRRLYKGFNPKHLSSPPVLGLFVFVCLVGFCLFVACFVSFCLFVRLSCHFYTDVRILLMDLSMFESFIFNWHFDIFDLYFSDMFWKQIKERQIQ